MACGLQHASDRVEQAQDEYNLKLIHALLLEEALLRCLQRMERRSVQVWRMCICARHQVIRPEGQVSKRLQVQTSRGRPVAAVAAVAAAPVHDAAQ